MGQALTRSQYNELLAGLLINSGESNSRQANHYGGNGNDARFRDLADLPPELALEILSNLGPTDLCLAGCVWQNLGNDRRLWRRLCQRNWPHCAAYAGRVESYRQLYLRLDEATLTFNADCFEGYDLLIRRGLVMNDSLSIALFLHGAGYRISRRELSRFLESRPDVLDCLMPLKSFANQFLPNALRAFFKSIEAPNCRNEFLTALIDRFSRRYADTNPTAGLSKDLVFILCFSLILLSVDLCSPHVRNKMSKREFIRNTRQAADARAVGTELLGHFYDNIYLVGHVAPSAECC